jgi:hypothetical protein
MKSRYALTSVMISTLLMLALPRRFSRGFTEEKWLCAYASQSAPTSDDWVTIGQNPQIGCLAGCPDLGPGVVPTAKAKRRTIPVTINKGECYVISNLEQDAPS